MRLIDADALNKEVGKLWRDMDDVDFGELVRDFWKVLNHFPTVDAEPVRHGRWNKIKYPDENFTFWECSACGYQSEAKAFHNYCPHCGAKMDGGET